MKVFKKICSFINILIIIALAVLALYLIVPRVLGMKTFAVLSGSMEPEIPVGSIVITEEVDPATITSGQIITYQLEGDTMVTHRVVKNDKNNKQFTTKGDANNVEDGSPVPYEKVVGHAKSKLPYAGYVVMYIKTPLGIACICGLLFILILLTFLPNVLSKDGDKKGTKEE